MRKWQGHGYRQRWTPPAFIGTIVYALTSGFGRKLGYIAAVALVGLMAHFFK